MLLITHAFLFVAFFRVTSLSPKKNRAKMFKMSLCESQGLDKIVSIRGRTCGLPASTVAQGESWRCAFKLGSSLSLKVQYISQEQPQFFKMILSRGRLGLLNCCLQLKRIQILCFCLPQI